MFYELCIQISTDTRQFMKHKKRCLFKTENFNNQGFLHYYSVFVVNRHEKPILIFAGWMQKKKKKIRGGKAAFFLILVQEPPTWLYCFLWLPKETPRQKQETIHHCTDKNTLKLKLLEERKKSKIQLCDIFKIHDNVTVTDSIQRVQSGIRTMVMVIGGERSNKEAKDRNT